MIDRSLISIYDLLTCLSLRYKLLFLLLELNVAVSAVDDTANIKIPGVFFHALDCCYILTGECNTREFRTIEEYQFTDACYAIANCHTRKICAAVERAAINASYSIANCHTRKTCAVLKSITPDARHTVRDCHTRKTCAVLKSIIPDARYAIRQCNVSKIDTLVKRIISDARHSVSDIYFQRLIYPRWTTIRLH